MTYNVVRKVSRSRSTAHSPFVNRVLPKTSVGNLLVSSGCPRIRMHHAFKGDLLVVGGQDIAGTVAGSAEFWDVRNPSEPRLLGRLPAPGSGLSSLDLIRRDGRLFG